MIPALVLTAGLATRLRPLSLVRAKAAVPVAGEPLVRRILRQLAGQGVTDAVLNLHHLPNTITAVVGDGTDLGIAVRYSWEVPVLGSAGGPRHALPLLRGTTFLIVNGDTLTEIDVASLVAAHRGSGALVTLALVPNLQPDKYGGVLLDAEGAVTGFAGRAQTLAPSHPRTVAPLPARTIALSFHFTGVQVVEAEAFAGLSDGSPVESVLELYPSLMRARPGAVRGHLMEAEFLDIGTPADYLQTSLRLAAREPGAALHAATARVEPTARLDATILWDDVEIGAGAMLRECIVTDGACVPAETSWVGVTIRRADGELADGERRIDGLAIASLG